MASPATIQATEQQTLLSISCSKSSKRYLSLLIKIANKRIGGGDHSSGHSNEGSQGSGDEKDVIVLTAENFDELVYGDKNAWFVEFYAPWCGHCQRLTPEWAALATQLKGEVKVAKIDATQAQ